MVICTSYLVGFVMSQHVYNIYEKKEKLNRQTNLLKFVINVKMIFYLQSTWSFNLKTKNLLLPKKPLFKQNIQKYKCNTKVVKQN